MGGISAKTNFGAFRNAMQTAAKWNNREGEDVFIDQAKKYGVELFMQTAAIAPTKAEIAADVKALGWKIPKWFTDGGKRGWRFGRGKKGDDGKQTLEQMQAKVIRIRANHARFLASGWLGAIAALGGRVRSKDSVDTSRGGIVVSRGNGEIAITLWNKSDGIETMDAKHRIVEKAMLVRAADMWAYITRKMKEARK